MKKLFGLSLIPLLFSLFSCQEVIFDEIRKEVELEDADISGDVKSLVRFGDYIYLQNGNIWRKTWSSETAHGWEKTAKPSASADYLYINKLAADSTYLYAQMTLFDEDTMDDGEIESQGCQLFYSSDGETWEGPVEFTNSEGETVSTITSGCLSIFCTNAPKEANRKAYAKFKDSTDSSYTVYQLNGGSASALTTISSSSDESYKACSTTPAYDTKSCAYFNGEVYFSSAYSMTTDESVSYTKTEIDTDGTEVETTVGEDKDATMLFYADSDTVYFTMDGTFSDYATINSEYGTSLSANNVDCDCSTIRSMTVTKDYLYLGTDDGIEHVQLTSYTSKSTDSEGNSTTTIIPSAGTSDFSTNADSTLSSYYEVRCVLAVSNSLPESEGVIYGTTIFSGSSSNSSATQENCGLWAYIPSRGKWNRE